MISEQWMEAVVDTKNLLLDEIEEFANSIPTRERYLTRDRNKHYVIMGLVEVPGERRTQRYHDPLIPHLIDFIETRYSISLDDVFIEESVDGYVPLWKVICNITELRNIAMQYNENYDSPYLLTSNVSRRIKEILFEILHIMSGNPLQDTETVEEAEEDEIDEIVEEDDLLDADLVDQITKEG
jgi:hypothetical protein